MKYTKLTSLKQLAAFTPASVSAFGYLINVVFVYGLSSRGICETRCA